MNRNYTMVQFLIDTDPTLMQGRATGKFFNISGKAYYGELPLSFAACTNQANLVKMLVLAGASLTAADAHGNTALHMCVWWERKDMYTFIEELASHAAKQSNNPEAQPS